MKLLNDTCLTSPDTIVGVGIPTGHSPSDTEQQNLSFYFAVDRFLDPDFFSFAWQFPFLPLPWSKKCNCFVCFSTPARGQNQDDGVVCFISSYAVLFHYVLCLILCSPPALARIRPFSRPQKHSRSGDNELKKDQQEAQEENL